MRRLLASILIVGAFLGGYHLGHMEGSPDIFAWARRHAPVVADSAAELVAMLAEPGDGTPRASATPSQRRDGYIAAEDR